MDICIDFDGTCVTHEFPKVGKEIGAAPILKRLVEKGHNLILFTMRSNTDGKNTGASEEFPHVIEGQFLDDALEWFTENDIPLFGIQANPTQHAWTTSPKAYGQLYIDDAAFGCPLIYNAEISDRPYMDWFVAERDLLKMGLI